MPDRAIVSSSENRPYSYSLINLEVTGNVSYFTTWHPFNLWFPTWTKYTFYSKARMHLHFAMALCAIEQGV